jgi:hypothetical protein
VLHKQYGKEYLMQRNHSQYYRKATSLWISPFVESKDGAYFAILLTLGAPRQRSCGKAGELQILRCQGIAVAYYSFILDAWSLKLSGFCNVGVNLYGLFSSSRHYSCRGVTHLKIFSKGPAGVPNEKD